LTHWIAKQLRRSHTSVVLKLKRMKISRRFREGYTIRELELCFGTDHHVIERWVREGRLTIQKRGTERERDAWMVNDEQILAFVRDHPLAFRLDKVEQTWFMDLITSGGLIRKAIADEHALTEEV
jgi:transposase